MNKPMNIEPIPDTREVELLLAAVGLPTADIQDNPRLAFFGVRDRGELVATAGIEPLGGQAGLLRSVAVKPACQGRGLATALVAFCEQWARASGLRTLHLLTITAPAFFAHKGYRALPRTDAPAEVVNTAQFQSLCPSAATLMHKDIA